MKRSAAVSWLTLALAASLLLAGCRSRNTPIAPTRGAPTGAVATAPAATRTAATAAAPTKAATANPAPAVTPAASITPLPAGWVEHRTQDLALWLPAAWEVLEFGQGDLEKIYADFQAQNPRLAQIIGSADALQGVSLWAFGPANSGAVFVDNLNVRRAALAGQQITDMKAVVDPIVAQYRELGFSGISSTADLRIGDRPAAYITYSFPFTGSDGQPGQVNGHQYLLATATDLWILSYASGPDATSASAATFAQSANSFRPQ
jgi:hypothetical protein